MSSKNDGSGSGVDTQCSDKLNKPTDLVGFPVFPPGTKSLLAKNLTREIWEKY